MRNNTTTITATAAQALIAAGLDLSEQFPGGVTIVADQPKAEEPKADREDGRNHAARKHNHDRRLHRFDTTARGGLTKADRQRISALLKEELGRPYTAEEWDETIAAYKAEMAGYAGR